MRLSSFFSQGFPEALSFGLGQQDSGQAGPDEIPVNGTHKHFVAGGGRDVVLLHQDHKIGCCEVINRQPYNKNDKPDDQDVDAEQFPEKAFGHESVSFLTSRWLRQTCSRGLSRSK